MIPLLILCFLSLQMKRLKNLKRNHPVSHNDALNNGGKKSKPSEPKNSPKSNNDALNNGGKKSPQPQNSPNSLSDTLNNGGKNSTKPKRLCDFTLQMDRKGLYPKSFQNPTPIPSIDVHISISGLIFEQIYRKVVVTYSSISESANIPTLRTTFLYNYATFYTICMEGNEYIKKTRSYTRFLIIYLCNQDWFSFPERRQLAERRYWYATSNVCLQFTNPNAMWVAQKFLEILVHPADLNTNGHIVSKSCKIHPGLYLNIYKTVYKAAMNTLRSIATAAYVAMFASTFANDIAERAKLYCAKSANARFAAKQAFANSCPPMEIYCDNQN